MMINLNMEIMPAVLQQMANQIASLTIENAILNATLENLQTEDHTDGQG